MKSLSLQHAKEVRRRRKRAIFVWWNDFNIIIEDDNDDDDDTERMSDLLYMENGSCKWCEEVYHWIMLYIFRKNHLSVLWNVLKNFRIPPTECHQLLRHLKEQSHIQKNHLSSDILNVVHICLLILRYGIHIYMHVFCIK